MPAMSPDNVLNSGQSYPCSFELLGAVKALEERQTICERTAGQNRHRYLERR